MTWLWFALFGLLALTRRQWIGSWFENWSDEALKRLAVGGLVTFGTMATFGLGLGSRLPWLHVMAGLAGVLGFFAMAQLGNRRSGQRLEELEKVRARVAQFREQQAHGTAGPDSREAGQPDAGQPRNAGRQVPPLIKAGDSDRSILDMLSQAAQEWEDPEVDVEATSEPGEPQQQPDDQNVAQPMQPAAQDQADADKGEYPGTSVHVLAAPVAKPVELIPEPSETASSHEETAAPEPSAVAESAGPISLEDKGEAAPALGNQAVQPPPAGEDAAPAPVAAPPAAGPLPSVGPPPEDSAPSAIDRAAGPISLGKAPLSEPAGPLSLSPVLSGQASAENPTGRSVPFVYEPVMIKSRLGSVKNAAPEAESENAKDNQNKPEEQASTPSGEPATDG